MHWAGRLLLVLFAGLFFFAQWAPEVPGAGLIDDKVGHAILYFGLAMALWPMVPASDALARGGVIVSLGYLLAILMEAGQTHLPHRTPDYHDVIADLVGLLIAAAPLTWAGMHPVRR